MTTPQLLVVRRCDRLYRHRHEVVDITSTHKVHKIHDRLAGRDTPSTAPDNAECRDISQTSSQLRWQDASPPLIRRLHQQDAAAIETHLLGLNSKDRRLRFFWKAADPQILAYVRRIRWERSLLLGAIRDDRVVGLAEAVFDGSAPSGRAEIAVSVDPEFRRRGLGRHLVGCAIDRAKLLGAQHAHLMFLQENLPLQQIVHSFGGLIDREDPDDATELVGMIRTDHFSYPARHFDPTRRRALVARQSYFDCRDQRRRIDRADPRDGCQPTSSFVGTSLRLELGVETRDTIAESFPLCAQITDQLHDAGAQARGLIGAKAISIPSPASAAPAPR